MQTKSEETNTHIGVNIQKQVAGVYKPQKTVTANSIESSNKNYQTAIESINESYQLPYIDDEDVADCRGMNKASKSCQSVVIEMPPDDKFDLNYMLNSTTYKNFIQLNFFKQKKKLYLLLN